MAEAQTTESNFPYAIVRTGGKQYKVSQGDQILVEKLELEP
ncbi:MAG TPA: bL21 family ribosomal protein, partial [Bdellovibrionota bacterium]|nr:bL21 family ribosomal protein [Bdellovibrionota bacterium]